MLDALFEEGRITYGERASYLANYQYFEESSPRICHIFPPNWWVASLDWQLYASPSYKEVQHMIENQPNARFGYIAQVGREKAFD